MSRGPTRFDFFFCTSSMNEANEYEHYWSHMNFHEDFIELLKKHGRLPVPTLKEVMDIMTENKEQKELIAK